MALIIYAVVACICLVQPGPFPANASAYKVSLTKKTRPGSAFMWTGGGEGCHSSYVRQIGKTGIDEESFFMAPAPDSNYYLAGRQAHYSVLLLVDQEGNVLDERAFDFTQGNDFIANFIVDSEGFIIGSARDQLNSATVNVLFKYDWVNDQVVWSKQIDDPAYTRIEGVYENPSGNNYIFYGMATNSLDEYIAEADRNTGNIQEQFLSDHGGNTDVFLSHFSTPEAVYFAGVGRLGETLSDIRPTLSKFDHAGNLLWTKIHLRSPVQDSRLYNMDLIIEDNSIVNLGRGSLSGPELSNSVLLLYKTNPEGELDWAKSYEVADGSEVWASKILPVPGGYIVQGAYLDKNFTPRLFFARLNKNGSVVWAKQIKTTGELSVMAKRLFLIAGNFLVFAAQIPESGMGGDRNLLFGQINLNGNTDNVSCEMIEPIDLIASDVVNPYEGNIASVISSPGYIYTAQTPARPAPDVEEHSISGCECVEDTVQVFDIPNIFSPNGDGINDTFYAIGKGISEIRFMRIFDRWGEKVFERTNFQANEPSLGWDGRFKGKPAVSDVFAYHVVLILNDGTEKVLKGDLTLLR